MALRPRFVVQAIAWVVLGLVALIVIDRSRHVLELVLVAVVLAVLLRAPIEALDRHVPRWVAITIVVLGSIASVAGLLALGTIQLRQEVDAVGQAVTQRIEEVDPNSQLGEFLVEARVAERIDEHLDRLPTQILIGSPDPADGARLGLEALLVIVLTLYALVNGPRLLKPVFGGDRPARWAGYVRDGVAAAASQVRRLLAISLISGLVGLAIASAFGLPGSSVLAIWLGVWAVVPIVGSVIGFAPMVVLASLDGWPRAAAIVVCRRRRRVRQLVRRPSRRRGATSARPASAPVHSGWRSPSSSGLQFGWLIGPLVAIFVMAAAVSTLAAFGKRARPVAPTDARSTQTGDEPDGVVHTSPRRLAWGRLDRRSALLATSIVVVVVAAIALIIDLSPVPVWVLIGITLSIALDPLVDWIADHTPIGRGASIGVVIIGLLSVVAATLVFAVPSVAQSVRDLDDQLPKIAADLEQLPLIGDELAERGIAERLQTTLEDAPQTLASDTGCVGGCACARSATASSPRSGSC